MKWACFFRNAPVRPNTYNGLLWLYNSAVEHEGSELLEAFVAETTKRRRATLNIRLAAGFLVVLCISFGVVTILRGQQLDLFMFIPLFVLLTAGLSSGMAASHKRSALAMSNAKNLASLGFLIECLNSGDAELTETLEQGLTPLLREAAKRDTTPLELGQEKALCTALQRTRSSSFFLAGLSFLEKTGTAYGLHTFDVGWKRRQAARTIEGPRIQPYGWQRRTFDFDWRATRFPQRQRLRMR